jgi:hypothetical protein
MSKRDRSNILSLFSCYKYKYEDDRVGDTFEVCISSFFHKGSRQKLDNMINFIKDSSLKLTILNNISEAEIFSHYLDIDIEKIYKCVNDKSARIHNPLRNDEHPSLGFQYYNRKLYAKDFGNPFYCGDCFYFVGLILKRNVGISADFIYICEHIYKTFSVTIREKEDIQKSIYEKTIKEEKIEYIKNIDIIKRDFDKYDLEYWSKYGLNEEDLTEEKIFACSQFMIDGKIADFISTPINPCYAYYLGIKNNITLWEIYRPNEANSNKFRTNNTSNIKELHLIKKNKNLILTKSKKDKALILKLLKDCKRDDIDTLYTSESTRISKTLRIKLEEHYDNIFINFDCDIPGIQGMKFFKSTYGYNLFPFIIPHHNDIPNYPKDITDFCKRFGYNNTFISFRYLLNIYIPL